MGGSGGSQSAGSGGIQSAGNGGIPNTGGAGGDAGTSQGGGGAVDSGRADSANDASDVGTRNDAADVGTGTDASDAAVTDASDAAATDASDAATADANESGSIGDAASDASDAASCGSPLSIPTVSDAAAAPAPAARWSGNGDAIDSVGGRNGTATGITYAAGVAGQAFVFDGVTSAITVPDGPILATNRNFSIVAWVKPAVDKSNVDQKVFVAGTTLGEFQLGRDPSDRPYFGVDVQGNTWILPTSPCPISANQWTQLVGIRRDLKAEIWVNGELWASSTVPNLNLYQATNTTSAIGAYRPPAAFQFRFHGAIDELRIYDVALIGEQIAKLYADEHP